MTSESFGDGKRKPHGPGNLFKVKSNTRKRKTLRFSWKTGCLQKRLILDKPKKQNKKHAVDLQDIIFMFLKGPSRVKNQNDGKEILKMYKPGDWILAKILISNKASSLTIEKRYK